MLQRNLSNYDGSGPTWWQDLGQGAPTIAGFAMLCSRALGDGVTGTDLAIEGDQPQPIRVEDSLNADAKVILALAARRGTFEIRGKQNGFDSVQRFLAVAVEVDVDSWRLLLDKSNPRQTIRFLEAFGLLCQHGLIIHHLQREFSLSSRGFALGDRLATAGNIPQELIEFGETL